MANSSTPFGFMPYGRVDGGAPTYELERVFVHSSDAAMYFTGDLVQRSTAGDGGNFLSYNSSGIATGGPVPAGVFWGCKYFSAGAGRTVWARHFPGSVGADATIGSATAYIISDPNVLFKAVGGAGDGGAGTTWATADIGLNTTIITSQSSFGNTVTGQSAMVLSSATARGSSLPWKIFDLLVNRAFTGSPNTESTSFNAVVVKPNNWERGAGVVGVTSA